MKNKFNRSSAHGFTLVELVVVITIIGILSTIGLFSFSRIQINARDSQRSSKITIIATALEKYYSQNGEYPSCADITQDSSSVVSNILVGIGEDVLSTPGSSTNSFICTDPTDANSFGYIGGAAGYTLKYYNESTSSLIPVESVHNSTPKTPNSPSVAVTQIGSNISATASDSMCITIGSTLQYSARSRVNEGTWGSYSDWATTTNFTQTANGRIKYGYQAQARCYVSDEIYSASSTSDEKAYISTDAVTMPAAPTVTASTGGTTTWS